MALGGCRGDLGWVSLRRLFDAIRHWGIGQGHIHDQRRHVVVARGVGVGIARNLHATTLKGFVVSRTSHAPDARRYDRPMPDKIMMLTSGRLAEPMPGLNRKARA